MRKFRSTAGGRRWNGENFVPEGEEEPDEVIIGVGSALYTRSIVSGLESDDRISLIGDSGKGG